MDEIDSDEDELRGEIIRRARGKGLEVAFDAAMDITKDAKAPPSARAAALNGLLKIADLDREKHEGREPHQMDGEELQAYAARLRRTVQRAEASIRRARSGRDTSDVPAGSAFD